jgi:hypothetical protein
MPGRCNRNALVAIRSQVEKVQGSVLGRRIAKTLTAALLDFLNPELPNP